MTSADGDGEPGPVKRIVLCATQRCGSTMICEDMWNTEVLGHPEEYFIPWNRDKENIRWADAWESVQRRASTPNGVCAFKVMANQLPATDACFATFRPKIDDAGKGLFANFHEPFRDACWVYIVREDVSKQAISQIMSRQTGIAHAVEKPEQEHFAGRLMRGYRDDYNAATKFNLLALKQRMRTIVWENTVWRGFFASHGITPLVLRYEDTVNDFPGYLYRVAEFAGIQLEQEPAARKLVKLSNELNSEWHRKLLAALVGEMSDD